MAEDHPMKDLKTSSSGYDLQRQIKAMDRFLELHEPIILKMESPVISGNLDQSFFDEFIDIHCTPAGQDFPFKCSGPWDSFYEAWKLVGSLLSNAMSYESTGKPNGKE
ncbi:MAG: hypothetical protein OXE59_12625 [Bacteroidetes bacterium]|nr:hypothetical protein [Bacteroidota bacterium]